MEKLQKILVPIDFSQHSEQIVNTASFMAERLGSELLLCHVAQKFSAYSGFSIPNISTDDVDTSYLEGATNTLNSYVAQVGKKDVRCRGIMLAGVIHEEIVKCAEKEDADMIIIGTHGLTGIEKFFMGSVAMKILLSAPCPVLKLSPYK